MNLTQFLNQKFKTIFLMVIITSFTVVLSISFGLGTYTSSLNLDTNLEKTAKFVNSLIPTKDWALLNDYFDINQRLGVFSNVNVKIKGSDEVLYENYSSFDQFVPKVCATNEHSDFVTIRACSYILPVSSLLYLIAFVVAYSFCIYIAFLYIRKNSVYKFSELSEDLLSALNSGPQKQSLVRIEEFEKIKQKLKEDSLLIKETAKKNAIYDFSRRVAHDIRSPIAVIKNITSCHHLDQESLSLLKKSANTLEEISRDYLENSKETSPSYPRARRINLRRFLNSIVAAKYTEYPELRKKKTINIVCEHDIILWFNPIYLERAISNLLNNSIQENLIRIIEVKVTNTQNLKIQIFDDGPGYPQAILDSFQNGLESSSKKDGYGIGLKSARIELSKGNAEMSISNRNGSAIVELDFPEEAVVESFHPIVLIDDDKYIRRSWEMKAKELNLPLITFSSVEEFLADLSSISLMSEIFIDSNLGSSIKGENYISYLYNLGFRRLNLQTGDVALRDTVITHLNDITTKNFPYQ